MRTQRIFEHAFQFLFLCAARCTGDAQGRLEDPEPLAIRKIPQKEQRTHKKPFPPNYCCPDWARRLKPRAGQGSHKSSVITGFCSSLTGYERKRPRSGRERHHVLGLRWTSWEQSSLRSYSLQPPSCLHLFSWSSPSLAFVLAFSVTSDKGQSEELSVDVSVMETLQESPGFLVKRLGRDHPKL